MTENHRLAVIMRVIELLTDQGHYQLTLNRVAQMIYLLKVQWGVMPNYNISVLADGPVSVQLIKDLKKLTNLQYTIFEGADISLNKPFDLETPTPTEEHFIVDATSKLGDELKNCLLNICLVINAVMIMHKHEPEKRFTYKNIVTRVHTLSPQARQVEWGIKTAKEKGFIFVDQDD